MGNKEEEISKWIELYTEPLLRRASALVEDRDDAMDLVQDVFLAALSSFASFGGQSAPLTWLQSILRNKVADFYRRQYRRPDLTSTSSFFDASSGSWTDHSVLNEWNSPEDPAEDKEELLGTLDKCIEHLPPQWRLTIQSYYLSDKKAGEVCQELSISTTNLWKILQRSRMQLRKCIELNYFDN